MTDDSDEKVGRGFFFLFLNFLIGGFFLYESLRWISVNLNVLDQYPSYWNCVGGYILLAGLIWLVRRL